MSKNELPASFQAERARAISFDAGFTLIEPWPPVGEVYADVARLHGMHCDPDQLQKNFMRVYAEKLKRARQAHRPDFNSSEDLAWRWWADIVIETFGRPFPDKVLDKIIHGCWERYGGTEGWRVYEDVFPALESLQQAGLTMFVVSNADSRLFSAFEALGLEKYFKRIFVSSQTGYCKPDERALLHACEELGFPRNTVLHIGDSPEMDLEAARRAGMECVIINRDAGNEDGKNYGTIKSLNHLPEILSI
ncbi:MAG: HAD-IA family hydrolase [Candidatus Sumerlaeia bacterium]